MSFITPSSNAYKYSFVETILSVAPLETEAVVFITDRLLIQKLAKNAVLLPFEAVCDRLYFIHSGLVRGYYVEDEKEITAWFVKENDFIYSPYSFLNQKPAFETIELLEDSVLLSLSYEDLHQLYDLFPTANKTARIITENYLLLYDERVRSLRSLTAEERFRRFITNYPAFYERVPLKYIASFLGIAPETVSRILKRKNKCNNTN